MSHYSVLFSVSFWLFWSGVKCFIKVGVNSPFVSFNKIPVKQSVYDRYFANSLELEHEIVLSRIFLQTKLT